MKNIIIIFRILVFIFPASSFTAKASQRCEGFFASPSLDASNVSVTREQINATQNLIAYLSALVEQQIIGVPEILRFIDGLEKNDLVNPIDEYQAWTSSAAMIHREEIENYLGRNDLDRMILLTWALKILAEKKRARDTRDEVHQETKDLNRKIEFHPLPPGSFEVGDGYFVKKVKVTLTNHFEVMSAPLTQKQWVELTGENPASFSRGENQTTLNMRGRSITLQPDHPVENITWWSALVVANKLSERQGYIPAYDLNGIQWKRGTRAEDGTLDVENINAALIRINAPKGNYYQAQGYRLPTDAEQTYLLEGAGQPESIYSDDSDGYLEEHAWYFKNSDFKTHAVAQLKPLIIINGKEFYDVLGNVWEWGWDFSRF